LNKHEYWLKCKEWWQQLAKREQRALLFAAVALLLFIAYSTFAALQDQITNMRKKLVAAQHHLSALQAVNMTLEHLEQQAPAAKQMLSIVSVLNLVQKQIAQAGLLSTLSELKQVSASSFALEFKKIEFDQLMQLLISIMKEHALSIFELSVQQDKSTLSEKGLVNAQIILKWTQPPNSQKTGSDPIF
jgi:type II secretory pathway component PulM